MNKKIIISISMIALLIFSIVGCNSESGLLVNLEMELIKAETTLEVDGITETKTREIDKTTLIKASLTPSQVNLLGLDSGASIYTNFSIKSSGYSGSNNTISSSESFDDFSKNDLKDMKNALIKIGNIISKESWVLIIDNDIVNQVNDKRGIIFIIVTPDNEYYFIDTDGDGKPDKVIDANGKEYDPDDLLDSLKNGVPDEE